MMNQPSGPAGSGGTTARDEMFAGRPLIIASNRGPITFQKERDGSFSSRKGSGGLVTAVASIARDIQPIWIAAAMGPEDRERAAVAEQAGERLIVPPGDNPEFRLRFVTPLPQAYHWYYNEISNPLLWFLQHYLWDTPRTPDITADTWRAWNEGYVPVNEAFAEEILTAADAVDQPPVVMLQDYHLYLVGKLIRERRPDAILQHFIHIPWPDPDYWRLLPSKMRVQILEGMLGNDIVGFQTPFHARSFMYTCEAYLPEVSVDYQGEAVVIDGRRVMVRAYPISIDTAAVRRQAYGKEARAYDRFLPNYWNEFTILRVDRAEPSKNIVRGFQAFDRFLEVHREYQGRVNFVAITVPSRLEVMEYQDYLDDVSAIAGRINAKYANVETGWQPVQILMGENYPRALAAMKWYDVLMVNSIIDGMNLVAKEGALLNERNGVIILSEGAGAANQLGEDALMVAPADVEGTADAIYAAVTMPQAERRARAERLRRIVEADDVSLWFRRQVEDINTFLVTGIAPKDLQATIGEDTVVATQPATPND